MPKFSVTITEVTTVIYDAVELEADDAARAEEMAEEMAAEGSLSSNSEDDTYTAVVDEIA